MWGMGTKKSRSPVLMEQSGAGKESGVGVPNRHQRPGQPSVQGLGPSSSRTPKEATTTCGRHPPTPAGGWGQWGGFPEPRARWAGRKLVLGRQGRLTIPCSCPGRGRPGWGRAAAAEAAPGGSYLGHGADVRGSGLGSAGCQGRGPGPADPRPQAWRGERWSTGRARPQPPGLACAEGAAHPGRRGGRGRPPPPRPPSPGPRPPALERRRVRAVLPSDGRAAGQSQAWGGSLRSSLSPSSQSGPCPSAAPLPSPAALRGEGGVTRSSGLSHTPPLPACAAAPSALRPVLPGEGRSMEAGPRLTGAHCTSVLCARWGPSAVPGRGTSR